MAGRSVTPTFGGGGLYDDDDDEVSTPEMLARPSSCPPSATAPPRATGGGDEGMYADAPQADADSIPHDATPPSPGIPPDAHIKMPRELPIFRMGNGGPHRIPQPQQHPHPPPPPPHYHMSQPFFPLFPPFPFPHHEFAAFPPPPIMPGMHPGYFGYPPQGDAQGAMSADAGRQSPESCPGSDGGGGGGGSGVASPRQWAESINAAWSQMLGVSVCEASERLRINSEYHLLAEDAVKWFAEGKRAWLAFDNGLHDGRNQIMLQQQQGLIELGFAFQAALTDPKKVYQRTRSGLAEERRKCKEELRDVMHTSEQLYASRLLGRLVEEEAEQRCHLMHEASGESAEVAVVFAAAAREHAGSVQAEVMQLRSNISATDQMHQQALRIARSVEETGKARSDSEKSAQKQLQKEKKDLEQKLSEASKARNDLRDQLEKQAKELKAKSGEALSKKILERTSEMTEKHEKECAKLTQEIATLKEDHQKRNGISGRCIKDLQEKVEELRREKADVESEQERSCSEVTDGRQIIEALEQELHAERRNREYEHAELQELRKQGRKTEVLDEQVKQAQLQQRKLQSALDACKLEREYDEAGPTGEQLTPDALGVSPARLVAFIALIRHCHITTHKPSLQHSEQYADLKQARYTVAHLYDHISNVAESSMLRLVGDLEYTARVGLKKEEAVAYSDISLMQQLMRRGVW